MNETIVHTIRDKSPQTKKDVEAFAVLIGKGYVVMDVYNYEDEYYYIMQSGHFHTHDGEKKKSDLKN